MFAALGDPTRLKLLARLSKGEQQSIKELTRGLTLSRQAVTKHLKVLGDAGLVRSERIGRESRFALEPRTITEAQDYLARISSQWDRNIARLRAHLGE